MLVLNRKPGEKVVLILPGGAEVVVTLCELDGRRHASLGFEAPPEVRIMRLELLRGYAEEGGRDG